MGKICIIDNPAKEKCDEADFFPSTSKFGFGGLINKKSNATSVAEAEDKYKTLMDLGKVKNIGTDIRVDFENGEYHIRPKIVDTQEEPVKETVDTTGTIADLQQQLNEAEKTKASLNKELDKLKRELETNSYSHISDMSEETNIALTALIQMFPNKPLEMSQINNSYLLLLVHFLISMEDPNEQFVTLANLFPGSPITSYRNLEPMSNYFVKCVKKLYEYTSQFIKVPQELDHQILSFKENARKNPISPWMGEEDNIVHEPNIDSNTAIILNLFKTFENKELLSNTVKIPLDVLAKYIQDNVGTEDDKIKEYYKNHYSSIYNHVTSRIKIQVEELKKQKLTSETDQQDKYLQGGIKRRTYKKNITRQSKKRRMNKKKSFKKKRKTRKQFKLQ